MILHANETFLFGHITSYSSPENYRLVRYYRASVTENKVKQDNRFFFHIHANAAACKTHKSIGKTTATTDCVLPFCLRLASKLNLCSVVNFLFFLIWSMAKQSNMKLEINNNILSDF